MVEHLTVNQRVAGSSPASGAKVLMLKRASGQICYDSKKLMKTNRPIQDQKGVALILEFLLVVLVVTVASLVWYRAHKINHAANQGQPARVDSEGCGNQKQLFTVSPIKEADLVSIIPLGNPNPPAHILPTDHIYLFLRRSGPSPQAVLIGPAAEVPVVSPGDIKVFNISAKEYLTGSHHTDYAVDFAPCNEVRGRFDHLASLLEKLISAFNKASGECQTSSPSSGTTIKFCQRRVAVSLKAGENIGSAGGPNGSNNLDFRLSDERAPALVFANPARWRGDATHVVCPVDYFSAPMKGSLEKLFGDSFGAKRTIAPVCGSVAEDVKSTAQGVWFTPGKPTYPEDQHIALVPDNIDPTQLVFSIGESLKDIGINPERYVFLPAATGNVNKEFKSVTTDGRIYCYQTKAHSLSSSFGDRPRTLLLQLRNETTIRIGSGPSGTCGTEPWNFTAYKEFER